MGLRSSGGCWSEDERLDTTERVIDGFCGVLYRAWIL